MRRKLPKTACTLFLLFISKGNTIWGVPYQTFTGLFTRGPAVLRQRRTGLHAINVDSFRDYKSLALDRDFNLDKDLTTYSVVFQLIQKSKHPEWNSIFHTVFKVISNDKAFWSIFYLSICFCFTTQFECKSMIN